MRESCGTILNTQYIHFIIPYTTYWEEETKVSCRTTANKDPGDIYFLIRIFFYRNHKFETNKRTSEIEKQTMGSSNDNDTNDESKGILAGAREAIHNLTQSEKDWETIEEGKKSAIERSIDNVQNSAETKNDGTSVLSALGIRKDDTGAESDNKTDSPIEKARETIYDATKTDEEKKLEEEAEKDIVTKTGEVAEKAADVATSVASKVDDALHAAVLPLEGKDYDDWKERKDKGVLER